MLAGFFLDFPADSFLFEDLTADSVVLEDLLAESFVLGGLSVDSLVLEDLSDVLLVFDVLSTDPFCLDGSSAVSFGLEGSSADSLVLEALSTDSIVLEEDLMAFEDFPTGLVALEIFSAILVGSSEEVVSRGEAIFLTFVSEAFSLATCFLPDFFLFYKRFWSIAKGSRTIIYLSGVWLHCFVNLNLDFIVIPL